MVILRISEGLSGVGRQSVTWCSTFNICINVCFKNSLGVRIIKINLHVIQVTNELFLNLTAQKVFLDFFVFSYILTDFLCVFCANFKSYLPVFQIFAMLLSSSSVFVYAFYLNLFAFQQEKLKKKTSLAKKSCVMVIFKPKIFFYFLQNGYGDSYERGGNPRTGYYCFAINTNTTIILLL